VTTAIEKFVEVGSKAQAAVNALTVPADSNSQSIELALIVPSKTNPDRAYDPKNQDDVDTMESIKVSGVVQPILIRPLKNLPAGKKYEIVAGERRWSCSIAAGRKTIPAVVRELTDIEALELQTIENDQRKDLDPIAKAAAFRRLWEAYEKSGEGKSEERMERMTARLGRKPRTVWNLLSLANLSPDGEKLLRDGSMSQSHAYEIARRTVHEQKKITEWFKEESRYNTVSVRDLKDYIRDNCDHFLDAATFPKGDAKLFPAAGACTTCPKNSAVNPNLVDPEDLKGKRGGVRAICTDGECFKVKVANNLVRIEKEAEKQHGKDMVLRVSVHHTPPKGALHNMAWKTVAEHSCKNTFAAVIVDGDDAGKQIFVCAATFCKTHWGRSASSSNGGGGRTRSDAEKKDMLQKQRNKQLDVACRIAATAALRKQVTALKLPDLQEIAVVLFARLDHRLQNPMMAAMGWKTTESMHGVKTPEAQISALKPSDLAAFIALAAVADKVLPLPDYYGHPSPLKLEAVAKRHKINLAKIRQQAAAPLQEKWKKIDAKKKAKVSPAVKRRIAQTSAAKKKKAA
jgi:ParB/RepB/Spo0J family partition protein